MQSDTNFRGIFKDPAYLKGIGVYKSGNQIRLLYLLKEGKKSVLYTCDSADGIKFRKRKKIFILDARGRNINLDSLSSARFARISEQNYLVASFKKELVSSVIVARESGLSSFTLAGRISQSIDSASLVPNFKHQGNFIAYSSGNNLRLLTSPDLRKWRIFKKPVLTLSHAGELETGVIDKINQGILAIYFESLPAENQKNFYSINAAIFDDQNPERLTFKNPLPIWEEPGEWNNLTIRIRPFGMVILGERLLSYWQLDENELVAIVHEKKTKVSGEFVSPPEIILKKLPQNPIIRPIPEHFWESKATFNPAALYDQGKVHIVYRAIGDHDMSMLGYAKSQDGIHIDYRSKDPVYVPTEPFEFQPRSQAGTIPVSAYQSGGGGYGGVEDPRLTKIGDKVYMTYVAYDGASPPRVALTSIHVEDLRHERWNWAKPVLMSKSGVVDKNAVIFPEKIRGKFAIMHRIFPDILIDFVDSLDFDGETFLRGEYKISPRKLYWDNRKIGAGAPPIKTDEGWLLIYQAVGNDNPGHYRMGAMLLDYDNPTKVLSRSFNPILEPLEGYENEGYKSGVVYPCGAVILGDELLVYYGGADTVTCVARANYSQLINDLKYHHTGSINQVQL